MYTANLENCKRLYEVSGWDEQELSHYSEQLTIQDYELTPKYDAGYLLRKLPEYNSPADDETFNLHLILTHADDYSRLYLAEYQSSDSIYMNEVSDTPEDALCLIAIKLFEEGILTRENK